LAVSAIVSVRQRTKEEKIRAVRERLESDLFPDATAPKVFEFRDAFYRVTSLSEVVEECKTIRGPVEVFRAVSHPAAELAARCAGRRDRRRMRDHLERAVDEFRDIVESRLNGSVGDPVGPAARLAVQSLEESFPAIRRQLRLDRNAPFSAPVSPCPPSTMEKV
jgi:hypothetical protein